MQSIKKYGITQKEYLNKKQGSVKRLWTNNTLTVVDASLNELSLDKEG